MVWLHGKFHRFLLPFSSKFSDLNFASYVLYNLPVLCHVSRTVSLGYLWRNQRKAVRDVNSDVATILLLKAYQKWVFYVTPENCIFFGVRMYP